MLKRKKKHKIVREGDAFITDAEQVSGADDDLAELLAKEYLQAATSGESSEEDTRDQVVEEELGGPFVEGTPGTEFGRTRFVNVQRGVERNPLPTAMGPLAIAAPDELVDEERDEDEIADEAGIDDEGAESLPEPDAEVASRVEPAIPLGPTASLPTVRVRKGRSA